MSNIYQMHAGKTIIGRPTELTEKDIEDAQASSNPSRKFLSRVSVTRQGTVPIITLDIETFEQHGPYYSFEECRLRILDGFSKPPIGLPEPEFDPVESMDADTSYDEHVTNIANKVFKFIESCAVYFDAKRPVTGHTAHGYYWYDRLVKSIFKRYAENNGCFTNSNEETSSQKVSTLSSPVHAVMRLKNDVTKNTLIATLPSVYSAEFSYVALRDILAQIKDEVFRNTPKDKRLVLCPCISEASSRGIKGIRKLSGIISFDFDNVSNPKKLRQDLAKLFDERVILSCISPSGTGVKLWLTPLIDGILYNEAYNTYVRMLKENDLPSPDRSQAHPAHLCFTPSDKDAIIGPYL